MASENVIVGLDIGTSKVCAVIGEYNENGKLEIIGVGVSPSNGLRRGVVINIESTLKSVIAAIEAAEMMSGREVEHVYTGIAGGSIEGLNSRGVVAVAGRGREITPEDITRVIDAAKAVSIPMDREVLHIVPQEFIVDGQGGIKDPLDMIGVRLESEIHIITGTVSSSQNLIKCVNRAGFRVNEVVLESLAASKAVLSRDEKELGVLLVDLGGGTTDVLIFMNGAPYYTNVIPLGGEQVTSDLSIMLKTPMETAEKIKMDAGCAYLPLLEGDDEVIVPGVGGRPDEVVTRRELCRIIQPRMAEIMGMVKEKIIEKGYLRQLRGGVVLTGGGALMPGAVELAQEVFGLPARAGYPMNLGGLVEEYRSPLYATGVGLVLYGDEKENIDGMPQFSGRQPKGSKGFLKGLKKWFSEFF